MLLDKGVNVNYMKKKFGVIVLMLVAVYGWFEIVEVLLSRGVDVNVKNYDGVFFLMVVFMNGYLLVVN